MCQITLHCLTLLVTLGINARALAGFDHLSLADAQATFIGEGQNEQAGWATAFAGDFNGDGYDDLLIGAQLNDQGEEDAGKAYLLLGRPGGFDDGNGDDTYDLALADASFVGEESEDYAGSAVASAGDVDGDGYDDILIGAWGHNGSAGRVYLIYGAAVPPGEVLLSSAPAAFSGEASGDISGYSLSPAGDVNADGYGDFLIGAPRNDSGGNNAGRAYLWIGGASRVTAVQPLKTAYAIFQGLNSGDYFGWALAGNSDVDRDGHSDLLIGAYGNDLAGNEAGCAYLFYGAGVEAGLQDGTTAAVAITGAVPEDQLGYSVSLAHDFDGDDIGDLFLGAPRVSTYETRAGAGIIIAGAQLVTSSISAVSGIYIEGDAEYDGAGQVAIAGGDINHDGLTDLLLSAPYADEGADTEVGKIAFIPGSADLSSERLSDNQDILIGAISSGIAGFSLAGQGDVDGDGHPDILTGAAGAGHAYLVLTGPYFDDDGDGLAELEGDCDDSNTAAYPGAEEIPYDGIDQDCDGSDPSDLDDDGFASTSAGGDDCDDTDPAINPEALETSDGVDQDCDGVVDDGTEWGDDDSDGYAEVDGDCDDANAAVYPDAPELDNDIDDDCDGTVDDGLSTTDDDGDGLSEEEGDCNDQDSTVFSGAPEVDDGIDQNCNGKVGENTVPGDADGDGFTPADGDIDDTDPTTYPGAPELDDGIDNNGNGEIDEDIEDHDGDGYSPSQGDTDDTDPASYPGAESQTDDDNADETPDSTSGGSVESGSGAGEDGSDSTADPGAVDIGDGVDNDGDGQIDEDTQDSDQDGLSLVEGDCDDSDQNVYPDAAEAVDGLDNDCDGVVDDHTAVYDDDGDGYSELDDDCDDDNPALSPEAAESCDSLDNDCNGLVDDLCTHDSTTDTTSAGDSTPVDTDPPSSSGSSSSETGENGQQMPGSDDPASSEPGSATGTPAPADSGSPGNDGSATPPTSNDTPSGDDSPSSSGNGSGASTPAAGDGGSTSELGDDDTGAEPEGLTPGIDVSFVPSDDEATTSLEGGPLQFFTGCSCSTYGAAPVPGSLAGLSLALLLVDHRRRQARSRAIAHKDPLAD